VINRAGSARMRKHTRTEPRDRMREEEWRCAVCFNETLYTPPTDGTITEMHCECGGRMFVVAARQQSEKPVPREFGMGLLRGALYDAKAHILGKSTRKRKRWDASAIEWNRQEYLESPAAYIVDAVLGISPEEQAAGIFSSDRLPFIPKKVSHSGRRR